MTRKTTGPATVENDMTPMIDVTFQLITFFMFVLNFSEAEQDERIQLPASQLAKPAEGVLETPITMQLTATGGVLYAGEVVPVDLILTAMAIPATQSLPTPWCSSPRITVARMLTIGPCGERKGCSPKGGCGCR